MQIERIQVESFEQVFAKDLGNAHRTCIKNPIEGIELLKILFKKAEDRKAENLLGKVLVVWGYACYILKEYNQGLERLHRALSILKRYDDINSIVAALNWIGIMYNALGEIDKALDFLLQSVPYLQVPIENHLHTKARVYSNLGMIYRGIGNYEKAIAYYEKVPKELILNKDMTACNIASVYLEMGNYEKALQYSLEAYALNVSNKNPELLYRGAILNNLIEVYLHFQELTLLLEKIKELMGFACKLKDTFFYNSYHFCLLNVYVKILKVSDTTVAQQILAEIPIGDVLKYVEDCIDNTDNLEMQIRSCDLLAGYYEELENWKRSYFYGKRLHELNVKKFEKEKMETTERLHVKHEVAQKEQQIQIQQLELEKKELELAQKKELERVNRQLEEKVAQRTAKLTQQNQQLREFAFIVSHDLREPLCNIHGISSLISNGYGQEFSEELQVFVNQLGSSAEYMNVLLKDLLDYTILGQNIDEQGLEMVDSATVLRSVINELQSEIIEANAQISIDGLPILKTSSFALCTVFGHLLSNALKFRNKNQKCLIEVSCVEEALTYRFSFKDNGIGIEKTHQERIFRIFQRLNKRDYGGTGIGLAVCKKAVESLEGEIFVESRLGEGSVFQFTIPKK